MIYNPLSTRHYTNYWLCEMKIYANIDLYPFSCNSIAYHTAGNIARTLGVCAEWQWTHETVLLDCMTGEAGSALKQHHSSAFHCHLAHTRAFSLLSHTYCVNTELGWRLPNELDRTKLLIFEIRNFFHCVAESWWNMPFKGGVLVTRWRTLLLLRWYDCSALWSHALWTRNVT